MAEMRRRGVKGLVFVDDFLLVADSKEECQRYMQICEEVLAEAHAEWAPHKKEGPTQVIVFLGVEIDTRDGHMCFRLPSDKVVALSAQIEAVWAMRGQHTHVLGVLHVQAMSVCVSLGAVGLCTIYV